MLFNKKVRTNTSPVAGISQFKFLDQSALPAHAVIRERLNAWFENYPADARSHLKGRFQRDDHSHNGAFFELILHEMLIRLGCTVEINDMDNTKRSPDFFVQYENKKCFIEATVVDPDKRPFARDVNTECVISKLEKLDSTDFRILVETHGKLSKALSKDYVTRPFKNLMSKYSMAEVQQIIDTEGDESVPYEEIKEGNWTLRGRLFPRSPLHKDEGIIMGQVRDAAPIDPFTRLRDALSEKAGRYGDLDAPYIIAVNARDQHFGSLSDDLNLLLGDLSVSLHENDSSPPKCSRKSNGIWPHYEQLDGVMIFHQIDYMNLHGRACLYINPSKENLHLPEPIYQLPHTKWIDGQIQSFKGIDGKENIEFLLEPPNSNR